MITERKLRTLKPATRIRKIGRLLFEIEVKVRAGDRLNERNTTMLIGLAAEDLGLQMADLPSSDHPETDVTESTEEWIREINRIRHAIAVHVGNDPADWDLLPRWSLPGSDTVHVASPRTGLTEGETSRGSGMRLYLEDIRSPFNVGSIFRTAAAFRVEEILLSPDCASPEHPRAVRTAMGAISAVPWKVMSLSQISETYNDELFALETGGIDIASFRFPRAGTVALGNEELGISPQTRKAVAQSGGICSIDLPGVKSSLNVSVAFGILVQRWHEYSHVLS